MLNFKHQDALIRPSLATYSVQQALSVVARLNSRLSRDEARVNIINAACKRPWTAALESEVNSAIKSIEDYTKMDLALLAAARSIVTARSPIQWNSFLRTLPARTKYPQCRCAVVIEVLEFTVSEIPKEDIGELINIFNSAIENIESHFDRVELLYQLVPIVAKKEFTLAENLYETALELNRSQPLGKRAVADVVAHCIALISRTLRPLMKYGNVTKTDLERLYRLCDAIPCASSRANIYADLATKFWCERCIDECKAVVKDKIRPLINACESDSEADRAMLISLSAPALYVAHPITALHDLNRLSPLQRSAAIYRIGKMMLLRKSSGEPGQDLDDSKISPDHEDLMDMLALVENVTDDWVIWVLIQTACRAISHKDNKTRLTGQQKRDFAVKAKELAHSKLPDLNNVTHDGYLIVCLAQTMRILEAKQPEWEEIILRARGIDNKADRAYILIEISKCLPPKMLDTRKNLLAEARDTIDNLPSSYDKYTRLEDYIRAIREVTPHLAKNALRDAIKITLDSGHRDFSSRWRRNLVDLADTVSADLSELVSELSDEDPARMLMKESFDRDIAIHGIRKRLSGDADSLDDDSSAAEVSDAAQRNLCSLISGRMQPRDPEKMIGTLIQSGEMYLPEAYPILAWYIENSATKCVRESDVVTRIRPLLEVVMLSSEIALSTANRLGLSKTRSPLPAAGLTSEGALMVRPGQRQEAIEFLRFWLRSNPSDSIVLCDAYFTNTDCEFLQIVLAECPDAHVTVLTSMKADTQEKFQRDTFLNQWKLVSDDEPPATEIIAMAGYENRDQILIHDRWLISGGAALRMGTSFNSLGVGKLSELSPVLPSECPSVLDEVSKYRSKNRLVNGVRAQYSSVTL